MSITIAKVDLDVSRLKLVRPFGFKGNAFTEKWLTHVTLVSERDEKAIGMGGGLAVLWSDADVFTAHTETGGNLLMSAVLDAALQLAQGKSFETPVDLFDQLAEPTYQAACALTGRHDLRPTFAINALVALDKAAWLLYAKRHGISNFDQLVPAEYRSLLSHRQTALACIPLLTYELSAAEIVQLVEAGHFLLKIKLGAAGDVQQMLEKDCRRLREVFAATKDHRTPHTDDGRLRYYLDMNGRYPDRAALLRLLEHAEQLGMRDQIVIIEEPFPEHSGQSVADLGMTVAADESLHHAQDVAAHAALGYGAVTLKPAGKTLSLCLKMAKVAAAHKLACFVADSACPPRLVDWNRNVAARLAALPGLNCGILESNGAQNYARWQQMIDEHPCAGARWLEAHSGMFQLDEDFYARGGGIFSG